MAYFIKFILLIKLFKYKNTFRHNQVYFAQYLQIFDIQHSNQ